MNVFFSTNLDQYKTNCFPNNLTQAPSVGDHIQVVDAFKQYYRDKRLPSYLEVRNVTWTEKGIECQLWYDELSVKIGQKNGVEMF